MDNCALFHKYWVSNARIQTKTDVHRWQGLRSSVFSAKSWQCYLYFEYNLIYISVRYYYRSRNNYIIVIFQQLSIVKGVKHFSAPLNSEYQFVIVSCFEVSRFELMHLINIPVGGNGEKWWLLKCQNIYWKLSSQHSHKLLNKAKYDFQVFKAVHRTRAKKQAAANWAGEGTLIAGAQMICVF